VGNIKTVSIKKAFIIQIEKMMKAFFYKICIFIFLFSCNKKVELPQTSGKINTISVIIDDKLWAGEIGDSIRNKFASPVIGLPQEEPLFTINQYPVKLLEGFMNNGRNIIVIKKENKNLFEIKENEFAKPQNVFYISAKNTISILELLEKNAPKIISKIRKSEILENQRQIDTLLFDFDKLENQFKIKLKVPQEFKISSKKGKFVWLKKEIISGNTSIIIYQLPLSAIQTRPNVINDIIKMRDSIGKLYIHGASKKAKMITETAYSPYHSYTILDKRFAYETKGTWEMENDYMSGPFINYCIIDKPNRRILVLEGFCYAPSKGKRDLMFELEAIIKTIQFVKLKSKKKSKNESKLENKAV